MSEQIMEKVDRRLKKHGGGPIPKYTQAFCAVAKALLANGKSAQAVYEAIGISEKTFYNWQKKYPEFLQSCLEGRETPNKLVESALLKTALGYRTTEVQTTEIPQEDGTFKPIQVKKIDKEIAPDVRAQQFWLINNDRANYQNSQQVDLKADITVTPLTREERQAEIEKLRKELEAD